MRVSSRHEDGRGLDYAGAVLLGRAVAASLQGGAWPVARGPRRAARARVVGLTTGPGPGAARPGGCLGPWCVAAQGCRKRRRLKGSQLLQAKEAHSCSKLLQAKERSRPLPRPRASRLPHTMLGDGQTP
jgi:hypothetical protein